jgi:hypothetical protein
MIVLQADTYLLQNFYKSLSPAVDKCSRKEVDHKVVIVKISGYTAHAVREGNNTYSKGGNYDQQHQQCKQLLVPNVTAGNAAATASG